ncbi:MAG: cobalamin biosynthesis protein CobD [Fretibacterium sp.]|nr:cobalamin biosynthesis protein CobD [Fretibacterium sp.]
MQGVVMTAVALFLDLLLGDPERWPHPVCGLGWVVSFWERRLYLPQGFEARRRGALLCAVVLGTVGLAVGGALLLAALIPMGLELLSLYWLYSALAWRSLKDLTRPVALSLLHGDLAAARSALSRVVGRDTDRMDAPAVVRAAVETVSENAVDGVFSVLFYALLGWLCGGAFGAAVGAWLFKAVNTLDSMVGYGDERYCDFGRAAARLDDGVNFLPARLGGPVMLLAGICLGYDGRRGLRVFLRDRKKHKSPNSAHGESVAAGLLGIRLGGGGCYRGVYEEKPWLGDETRPPEPEDILRAHELLDASTALFALLVMAAMAAW